MIERLDISKFQQSGKSEFNPLEIPKLLIDPNETIPPPPAAWCQMIDGNETIMGTLGNFSLLLGKAKSRKSFLTGLITSFLIEPNDNFFGKLPPDKNKILFFDTEQGKYHCQKALKRIIHLCNENDLPVKMYGLRSKSPKYRKDFIEHLITTENEVGFVIIDGVRDLINSINDEKEAMDLSADLLRWTEEKNIHILTVLHQNKGNEHARGHIGSELINKADTVLSVTKSRDNENISIVEAEFCRNKEPKPFAFEISEGLPVLVEDFEIKKLSPKKLSVNDIEDHRKYELFTKAFSKCEAYGYQELVFATQMNFKELFKKDIGVNKTKEIITYAKDKSWILQAGSKKPYSLGSYNNTSV